MTQGKSIDCICPTHRFTDLSGPTKKCIYCGKPNPYIKMEDTK